SINRSEQCVVVVSGRRLAGEGPPHRTASEEAFAAAKVCFPGEGAARARHSRWPAPSARKGRPASARAWILHAQRASPQAARPTSTRGLYSSQRYECASSFGASASEA